MYLNLCEAVRPDVLVMSQQLMSYEWSVPHASLLDFM
jgi:hypothetical protein